MIKVAVITLHTVSNYGSCLQTYATQTVLEGFGVEPTIIDYYRKDNLPEYAIERAFAGRRLQKYQAVWEHAPWLKRVLSVPMSVIVRRQRKPFEDFRREYLRLTPHMYRSVKELYDFPVEADVYCTGSDQVWNSIWNRGFEEPYYLTFAPDNSRRIAYAASIGRDQIDDWERPLMKEALSRYSAISMREASGVEILHELGLSKTELVLDPTLMLDRDQWGKIASMPKFTGRPYILVYQLNKSRDFVNYVEAVARKYGIDVVKISYGIYDIMRRAKTLIAPSVGEFLGLFLNAAYVITDSFHATAYSLNFGIPFTVIAPERFSTRIDSILRLTGTEDRLLTSPDDTEMFERPIDFEFATRALDEMRESSRHFLEGALFSDE